MHVSSSISTKHLNASARLQNQVHVRVYKYYDKDDYCENKKRTACDKEEERSSPDHFKATVYLRAIVYQVIQLIDRMKV